MELTLLLYKLYKIINNKIRQQKLQKKAKEQQFIPNMFASILKIMKVKMKFKIVKTIIEIYSI